MTHKRTWLASRSLKGLEFVIRITKSSKDAKTVIILCNSIVSSIKLLKLSSCRIIAGIVFPHRVINFGVECDYILSRLSFAINNWNARSSRLFYILFTALSTRQMLLCEFRENTTHTLLILICLHYYLGLGHLLWFSQ